MANILERKSVFGAKKESTFGVDPGSWVPADGIAAEEGLDVPSYNPDMQERNVIANSFFAKPKIRGAETDVSGSVQLELAGSGSAAGAPESAVLWESAIGATSALTGNAAETVGGSTTTALELDTGDVAADSIVVGDVVFVQDATNGFSVTWVTAIATDQLTVSPALAIAPGTGVPVHRACTRYNPHLTEQVSFYTKFWQGDTFLFEVPGCKVSSLTIDFTTGEIIKPTFNYNGQKTEAGVAETSATGLGGAATFDAQDPLVAVLMEFEIGGSVYAVSNASLEITNEHYKSLAITTDGITDILRTGGMISGSFSLEMEDLAPETAFRADTTAVLRIAAARSVVGNAVAFELPEIRYTAAPKTVDSGIYKYDMSFDCQSPSNVDANTIRVSFF
jgi:hypothetical protein